MYLSVLDAFWPTSTFPLTMESALTDFKLIYYYGQSLGSSGAVDEPTVPEWELFDLQDDPAGTA